MAATEPRLRRTDLDWLRVLLFSGLIAYHVGLMYSAWSPFALKSVHRQDWIEVLLLATHPWRMSLLFLISGVATRFAVDKLGASKLFLSRSIQLLPPLLFAVAFIVPIQSYLSLVENLGYRGSFGTFLPALLRGGHTMTVDGRTVGLPVYAHLWFVAYLWVYVAVVMLALAVAPRWVKAAQTRLETLLSGVGLLMWPLVVLATLRFTLFPVYGTTLDLVNDWDNHAVSLGMFLLGFLLARSERVWERFVALRWPALALAATGWGAYAALVWIARDAPDVVERANPVMHLFHSVERWAAIVAILGFARRHLRRDCKALRYLNGGMFTYYIVHQPAILLLLHGLKPLALHPGVEFTLVIAGAVGVCALAYEIARSIGGFGMLLGARPRPRVKGGSLAARGAPSYGTGAPAQSPA